MALMASFGKRFGKKKSLKINDLPLMTQIVSEKCHECIFDMTKKKKESEK